MKAPCITPGCDRESKYKNGKCSGCASRLRRRDRGDDLPWWMRAYCGAYRDNEFHGEPIDISRKIIGNSIPDGRTT